MSEIKVYWLAIGILMGGWIADHCMLCQKIEYWQKEAQGWHFRFDLIDPIRIEAEGGRVEQRKPR